MVTTSKFLYKILLKKIEKSNFIIYNAFIIFKKGGNQMENVSMVDVYNVLVKIQDNIIYMQKDIHNLDKKIDNVRDELNAKIDDVETRLNAKIDDVETRLNAKIDDVETRLNAKIDDVETRLNAKIDNVRDELNTKIDNVRDELNKKIDNVRDEFKKDISNLSEDTAKLVVGDVVPYFEKQYSNLNVRVTNLENFAMKHGYAM